RGVAERDHAAIAEDQVEAERGDGEDHDPAEEVEIEGLVQDGGHERHGGEGHQANAHRDSARRAGHQRARAGNRPCGRTASTAAISRYIRIEASAGPALSAAYGRRTVARAGLRNARPSVSTMPTTTAPTRAPRMDPMPP